MCWYAIIWAAGIIPSAIIQLHIPTKIEYENDAAQYIINERGAKVVFTGLFWPVICFALAISTLYYTMVNLCNILGRRSKFIITCSTCKGNGNEEGIGGRQAPCPNCDGRGQMIVGGADIHVVKDGRYRSSFFE